MFGIEFYRPKNVYIPNIPDPRSAELRRLSRNYEHPSRVHVAGRYGSGKQSYTVLAKCPFCDFMNTDNKNRSGKFTEMCDHLVDIIGGCGVSGDFIFENPTKKGG